jgi:hypothetical protein
MCSCPIGKSHAEPPLVHVIGRAVSGPMSALNLPPYGDVMEAGQVRGLTRTPWERDRCLPIEWASAAHGGPVSDHMRPRRSVNSRGPVTVDVALIGIRWMDAVHLMEEAVHLMEETVRPTTTGSGRARRSTGTGSQAA